jgi:hypothetical protein
MENGLKNILKIIYDNQGGFMQKCQIIDNIIMVQEAMNSTNENKDKRMIIKIDMANTFDRIRHSLILHILSKFGFNNKFVQ